MFGSLGAFFCQRIFVLFSANGIFSGPDVHIEKLLRKSQDQKDESTFFDACCEILFTATTLTEEEVFNLSKEEIEIIADIIYVEINKKK